MVPGALGRTLYYPSQPPASDLDDGTIGVAAHTDIECFTFLLQGPNVSCLQVLNKVSSSGLEQVYNITVDQHPRRRANGSRRHQFPAPLF